MTLNFTLRPLTAAIQRSLYGQARWVLHEIPLPATNFFPDAFP
jgi:hypothetical protein